MAKLIIKIEASEVVIDLDGFEEDFFDEETGKWDDDGLYDGFIHEVITQPEYTTEIVE